MNTPAPTIVVVDDEYAYAEFLATVLKDSLQAPVRTFARPHDALAALPGLGAGVIITDYSMPEMNGLDFIRAASACLPAVPCIVISGHAAHLVEQDLSGFPQLRGILAKPFSVQQLAELILACVPGLRPAAPTLRPAAV